MKNKSKHLAHFEILCEPCPVMKRCEYETRHAVVSELACTNMGGEHKVLLYCPGMANYAVQVCCSVIHLKSIWI